jgi:hypothetical protein
VQSEETAERLYRTYQTIPVVLVASCAALLLTMPRSGRGRPRKSSTEKALELAESGQMSARGAARFVAALTGEETPDQIASRVRGIKRRPSKGGKKLR